MILIQERLSVAFFDSSPFFELDDEESDQPASVLGSSGASRPNLPIARLSIPMYTKKHL